MQTGNRVFGHVIDESAPAISRLNYNLTNKLSNIINLSSAANLSAVQCESKKPLRFSNIFSKLLVISVQILHAYYRSYLR